jgi:DnaJ-class molecular chaperone
MSDLPPQTTGFLATECPSCEGSGDITWLQGMEQLRYSAPCDDCSGTGWIVDADAPAISIEHVTALADGIRKFAIGQNGHEILDDLIQQINDEFQEAR